jgi:uncharacterized membrane protein
MLAPMLLHCAGMKALGKTGITMIVIAAAVLLFGGACVATYNKLVRLDQAAAAQWAQVENTYQRRADLVPNLVETVKGAAAFERQTITEVTEARSRVGQVTLPRDVTANPEAFRQYQYGLEDKVPDAIASRIIREVMAPRLRAGDRDGTAGLVEGIAFLARVLSGPFPHARGDINELPDPPSLGSLR